MRRENNDGRPPLERLVAMGATDLTARAQAGLLSHAYGRDDEIEQVCKSLIAKKSVLLLGEAEVGKTAILHEIIARMLNHKAPEPLRDRRVVSISTGAILAGTEYLGDWQTRLTDLLDAIKQDEGIFLYIEDIWGLRDAGRASDKADGFATLIRPYLERQDIVMIGESTPENYASGPHRLRGLADEKSLMKNFNIIRVEETNLEDTKGILLAVARQLQRQHKLRIEASAIERGLELTRRYLPYQAFPGKAIRLLDETTARYAPGEPDRPKTGEVLLTADTITTGFSRITGLPEKIISDRVALTQDEIRGYFEERVVGQDEAVTTVVNLVTLVKAELHDPNRPLGVLFFVGPTGVGKTEMAKTLAEYLFGSKEKLIRFDMSEFKTYSSLPELVEQLTEQQRRQSFSVLLLDEIEKAGPFIFDLFLPVFDDARLADATGRSVDLHNTIIVMTSNLGSELFLEERTNRGMGFVEAAADPDKAARARRDTLLRVVEESFRPEFINRLDKIVIFQPLGVEEMRKITRRELGKALLREGVMRRNILLDFTDEVVDFLVTTGFSATYGARPLQRAIKDNVLMSLARKIAAQPAAGEQLLELCVRAGQVEAEIIPSGPLTEAQRPEPEPVEPRERLAVREAASGRARTMDLRQLEEAIAGLRERVEAHIASERYQTLRTTAQQLLAEVNQPSFWDDQQRSRQTLSTIYHLEQITDRFTNLQHRIEGLAEVATMIRIHHDVPSLRDLAARYEALDRDVALAELELVAGDGGQAPLDAAFVCVTPLSAPRTHDASEWAGQLGAMYAAWAQRQGYEVETVSETGAAQAVLLVRGANIHAMLRGEDGLHKMQREPAGLDPARGIPGARRATQIQLARVEVLPVPSTTPETLPFRREDVQVTCSPATLDRATSGHAPSGHAGARAAADGRQVAVAVDRISGAQVRVAARNAEWVALALLAARAVRPSQGVAVTGGDEVARIYYLARSQYVRDPRTNHRERRPREVLDGRIGPFLYAYLSRQRASVPALAGGSDGANGEDRIAAALLASVFGESFGQP